MHSFANKLDHLLSQMKGGETKLAEVLGISQPTVNRWRHGIGGGPSIFEAQRIAEFFNVPLSGFLDATAPPPPLALRDTSEDYLIEDCLADVVEIKERIVAIDRKLKRLRGSQ